MLNYVAICYSWRVFFNTGHPQPLFGLLLRSFLETQLQQTYWRSIGHIRALLTRLIFTSGINSMTGGRPGWVCTVVAWLFTSRSSYHGAKSCRLREGYVLPGHGVSNAGKFSRRTTCTSWVKNETYKYLLNRPQEWLRPSEMEEVKVWRSDSN